MGEPRAAQENPCAGRGLHALLVRQLAVALGPHGHQLLGGSGMERDGGVKVLLGRPHFHAHRHDLDNLGAVVAEYSSTFTSPRLPSSTPAFSTCNAKVLGMRPIASMIWSQSILPPLLVSACRLDPRFSTLVNSQPNNTSSPRCFIDSSNAS